MKLFWVRGYAATSLPQLLEVMNIARSSFYATFKDKRSVFVECLELFSERTLAILHTPLADSAPHYSPAYFFQETLLAVSARRSQHGCMMVNTILELADVDPALGKLAARGLSRVEQRFEALLAVAQQRGGFRSEYAPGVLAQYIMNVNQGLRVQSRKRVTQAELRNLADTSLAMAGLPTIAALSENAISNRETQGVNYVR